MNSGTIPTAQVILRAFSQKVVQVDFYVLQNRTMARERREATMSRNFAGLSLALLPGGFAGPIFAQQGRLHRTIRWIWFWTGLTLLPQAAFASPPQFSSTFVSTSYSQPPTLSGQLITVPAGGAFQEAIERAQTGDIIELQAGAIENLTRKAWISIQSSSPAFANNSGRLYTFVPSGPAIGPSFGVMQAAPQSNFEALVGLFIRRGVALDHFDELPNDDRTEREADKRGWPMRGKDRANTGHSASSGPAVQTQPVWTFQPDANTFVWRPSVAPDGTIYVTTASFQAGAVDGRLYALRADGSLKWQTELANSSGVKLWTSATPIIDRAGNIYVAWAHDLDFRSLTAISFDSTGKIRWRFEPTIDLELANHQQPVLGERVLYAAVDTSFTFGDVNRRAAIFALDLATGEQVWRWNSPNLDTFFAGPVVGHDGHIYQASASNPLRGASGFLYRIRPNGVLAWSVNIGTGVNEPPAMDTQDSIYLGDQVGIAFKYNSAGFPLWKYDTMSGQIFTSPVLNGARVAVGGNNAGLHVLDARTGKLDAVFAPGKFPMSQASDRTGNVFFYTFDAAGTVFAFGQRGRQRWSFVTGAGVTVNAVAIATNGKLLVSNSQTLKAYVAPVLGDLNCDGAVNAFDIGPFALAITDPARYMQRYPACYSSLADINGDGAGNAPDIAPFFRLLDDVGDDDEQKDEDRE